MKRTTGRTEFEARRLIVQKKSDTGITFVQQMEKVLAKAHDPFTPFPQQTLDRMYDEFWSTAESQDYMSGRAFTDETLQYFRIGYSAKQSLVTVPMHDHKGNPIGVIGRSIVDKRFKNSPGLPTSKTLWNMHRAKQCGETVIITEASFDAMRVHQAGYPNVVACLGGNFSPHHLDMLDRTFNNIVIMTDFDKKDKHMYIGCRKCAKEGLALCKGHNPGRDLGEKIADQLGRKRVLWASYEQFMVYPHDAKDAGDMTDNEIRQSLRSAVPNFEYRAWDVY